MNPDDDPPDNSLRAWLWLIGAAALLAGPIIFDWIFAMTDICTLVIATTMNAIACFTPGHCDEPKDGVQFCVPAMPKSCWTPGETYDCIRPDGTKYTRAEAAPTIPGKGKIPSLVICDADGSCQSEDKP